MCFTHTYVVAVFVIIVIMLHEAISRLGSSVALPIT